MGSKTLEGFGPNPFLPTMVFRNGKMYRFEEAKEGDGEHDLVRHAFELVDVN